MNDLNFNRYINAVKDKNSALDTGTQVDTIRKQGTQLLEDDMLNSKFNETWRFTDLKGVIKRDRMPFDENRAGLTKLEEQMILENIDPEATTPIVFINGQLWHKSLRYMEKEKHLTVHSVLDIFNKPGANRFHAKMLESADFDQKDPFFAMNLADLHDGLWLELRGNSKPLHMLYYFNTDTHNCVSSMRHFLVIKKGVHTSLIETLMENDTLPHTINLLRQFILEKESSFEHVTAFNPGRKTNLFNHTEVEIGKKSYLYSGTINSGGQKTRNNQNLKLSGENSTLYSGGFYITAGNEQIDNYTDINHVNLDTKSTQLYKGILTDTSHAVFRGKIKIARDIKKADASQLNRNILLSPHAHINSMPWLEIDSDDVKCSHGSATGSMNPDELFYMTSRGIREQKARDMILRAFAQEISCKIKEKTIRLKTQEIITKMINNSLHLKDNI